MKKGVWKICLGFIFLLMLVTIINETSAESVTGKTVSGKATQVVSMSISIRTYFPLLTIISPENKTYLTNESLLLNYSVNNEDTVWYNLDNSNNITLISPTTFNVSQGSHTLYLYANSSYGNTTSTNVSFFVNSNLLTILYSEYRNSTKGESTDFISYSYEDLQNLSNIVLENTLYGKFLFNEEINLSDDENPADNILDLNTNINISLNRIELNSTALPNFNIPATIWIYNLTFSNPRILKDGEVCSSSICTFKNYSEAILKFNVTGFSVYSAEETPTTETIDLTTGGGGGGTKAEKKDFSVDKDQIQISLKQGETKKEIIKIKNIGTEKIKISLEVPKLERFLKISETNFEINPKEEKIITLDFIAREDTIPDLYLGNILIKKGTLEEKILIAIEVESKGSLFDVKAEIPKKFLYVMPGEELMAQISLYNLGEIKRVDVDIDYIIKDKEGKEILSESETIAVETQMSFLKSFKMPEEIESGKYVFYIRVSYDGKIASSSAWFIIGENLTTKMTRWILRSTLVIWIINIILAIILIFIIYRIKKQRKKGALTQKK